MFSHGYIVPAFGLILRVCLFVVMEVYNRLKGIVILPSRIFKNAQNKQSVA